MALCQSSGCPQNLYPIVFTLQKATCKIYWHRKQADDLIVFRKFFYSWSFGIVLWEIMTFGADPYPKLSSDENEIFKEICNGYKMEKPSECNNRM
jgi:hypothetical protein